jgi:hypothetical protein
LIAKSFILWSMAIRRFVFTVATATWLLSLCAFGAESNITAESLTASDATKFRQLHALIKPKATEENWVKIPWMTGLWEARERAAAQGKPILLWEMDGHPLGCT